MADLVEKLEALGHLNGSFFFINKMVYQQQQSTRALQRFRLLLSKTVKELDAQTSEVKEAALFFLRRVVGESRRLASTLIFRPSFLKKAIALLSPDTEERLLATTLRLFGALAMGPADECDELLRLGLHRRIVREQGKEKLTAG